MDAILGWALLAGIIAAIWFGRRRGKQKFQAAIAIAIAQGRADATAEARAAAVASGGSVAFNIGRGGPSGFQLPNQLDAGDEYGDDDRVVASYDRGIDHDNRGGRAIDVGAARTSRVLRAVHPAGVVGPGPVGFDGSGDHLPSSDDIASLVASLVRDELRGRAVRGPDRLDGVGELPNGARHGADAVGVDAGAVGADRAGYGRARARGDIGDGVTDGHDG